MTQIAKGSTQIFAAQAATGVSTVYTCNGFRHPHVVLAAYGGTVGLTVKVRGSIVPGVDLTAARSQTNPWDYVACYDLEDASLVDGDTGVAFVAADQRQLRVNSDHLDQLALEVTSFSNGALNAWAQAMDGG